MSNAGGAIVAIRKRKEREIVAILRERAALSETTATRLAEAEGFKGGALRSLIGAGAVKETGSGTFYLDEAAYDAMQSSRRFRSRLVLLAVIIAFAVSTYLAMANA